MKVKDKRTRDKFYKLAKETGYRSRASFKLVQLNRKFEFLQKSRVLIDLCAAPGGWLQVAQQSMPLSSVIIGVDLVPIKSIPHVISLQADITTESCRQLLKKELKTWKADAVLHDGAPNVGKNWLHDAFAQNRLTLSALKLASEMLVKGGWFVTKVFRSKDYNALLWVFKKLFKKVHVTKPQASRNESSEIFVVCESFIAPDKIDPKFLDPTYLFEDVESKGETTANILKISKKKKKAEGYNEDSSKFQHLKASDFIFGDNHMDLLNQCSEIVFDDDDISIHKLTTEEIRQCCRDIKVLGPGEVRCLLTWRKRMRTAINGQEPSEEKSNILQTPEILDNGDQDINDAVIEAENLQIQKAQELKRKKKKMLKEKRKLHERINLKMTIQDDEPIIQDDIELFRIFQVKKKEDLDKLDDVEPELCIDSELITEDEDENVRHRKRSIVYDRHVHWDHSIVNDEAEEVEPLEDSDEVNSNASADLDIACKEEEQHNPLLFDPVDKNSRLNETVKMWFDKEDFDEIATENDIEMELLAQNLEKVDPPQKGGRIANTVNKVKDTTKTKTSPAAEVSERKQKKRKIILDPEGLALGAMIVKSNKIKRDLFDNAYNRYASNDVGLPDWFVKDEEKHSRKMIPVTAEMVSEYRDQLKEINARPIKKVVEAKARKKKKEMKRNERARKKAEEITESLDMSEKEKFSQIKAVYKKAQVKKDTNVAYVVSKKKHGGKVKRPANVRGRYKVVDQRMKKDDRKRKAEEKKRLKKNKATPKRRRKNN